MNVRIPGARSLKGTLRVPGDKSIAHRALLLGAMAEGWTRIAGVPRSADVSSTMRALGECGVQIQRNDDAVIVQGAGPEGLRPSRASIDCGNSGTTMRLLMGMLAPYDTTAGFYGDASLSRRPMARVAEPLTRMGARVVLSSHGGAPLRITGTRALRAIDYALPVASAQLKSAVLLAGLRADGRTRLRGKISSRDHTERILPQFGVDIDVSPSEIAIEGWQRLRGAFVEVPGDPSSAAAWIAAALVTAQSEVRVAGVCLNPMRSGFLNVVRRMGAEVQTHVRRREPEPSGDIRVRSSRLRGGEVRSDEVPSIIDELPLLAVLATQAHGRTEVHGASELRVKESDRIEAVAHLLRAMGGYIEVYDDGFAVEGPQRLHGGDVDSRGDHRIAMAASIAALCASGATSIRAAECAGVSYPGFFSTLARLL